MQDCDSVVLPPHPSVHVLDCVFDSWHAPQAPHVHEHAGGGVVPPPPELPPPLVHALVSNEHPEQLKVPPVNPLLAQLCPFIFPFSHSSPASITPFPQ